MKTIFKEGDRVYHFLYGWGDVIEILDDDDKFWVRIQFDKKTKGFEDNFREGFLVSFTEYTLEGFSQERPEELPKRGDVVWVRDNDNEPWFISHFISKENEWHLTSFIMNDKKYLKWRQLTTKNPYENE